MSCMLYTYAMQEHEHMTRPNCNLEITANFLEMDTTYVHKYIEGAEQLEKLTILETIKERKVYFTMPRSLRRQASRLRSSI